MFKNYIRILHHPMAAKLYYCLFLISIGQASSVVTHSLKRLEIDPELATQLAGLDFLKLPQWLTTVPHHWNLKGLTGSWTWHPRNRQMDKSVNHAIHHPKFYLNIAQKYLYIFLKKSPNFFSNILIILIFQIKILHISSISYV